MVRSLSYLIVILVSSFLLVLLGSFSGGLVAYFFSSHAALPGALAGLVVGLCLWFKLVGHLIEHEHLISGGDQAGGVVAASSPGEGGPLLAARDARWGNHVMVGGAATFLSALISAPSSRLVVVLAGAAMAAVGFVISLAAHEYPSEADGWRRVKLMFTARTRT